MVAGSIRTTVVGSYPVPDWLLAAQSLQGLMDATRAVFQIQEQAGIDVVVDGELYCWDVNHPDTNGVIDYFVRPMAGIRSAATRAECNEFEAEYSRPQECKSRIRPRFIPGCLGQRHQP